MSSGPSCPCQSSLNLRNFKGYLSSFYILPKSIPNQTASSGRGWRIVAEAVPRKAEELELICTMTGFRRRFLVHYLGEGFLRSVELGPS
jgi:hypothetical protein